MKKSVFAITALLLLLPALIFAGGSKGQSKPKTAADVRIAVVNQDQSNPVFYDLEMGSKDTAKKLGIQLEYMAPESYNLVKEAELFESAANAGFHAIGIVVGDSTLQVPMEQVSKRGILVSAINNTVVNYNGLAFMAGSAHYELGFNTGKLAIKYLTDKNKTYSIAMITGEAGIEAFELRMNGFKDALTQNGVKFNVAAVLPCNDDIPTSRELVETYTRANPNLDAWFFAGGWPYMLEVKTFPELAKWKKASKTHYVFTVDAFPPMQPFFEAGLCEAAVGQDYYRMGELTVNYLYKLVMGETLPKGDKMEGSTPWYSSGSMDVTIDNWKEKFGAMKPW